MASKAKKPEQKESDFAEMIRRFKERPLLFGGTVLILIIVIIAFVFVPAIPNLSGDAGGGLVFGYYNGIPLSYVPDNYFADALAEAERMEQFNAESDYSQNIMTAMRVWESAFMRTMVHTAVLEEMKNAGYSPPKDEIDRQVAALPDFQEDGRFSSVKYRRYDKNRLLTLWRRMEEDYIQNQYIKNIYRLRVSSREKAFISAMNFPQRSFDMAVFPRSDFPDSEIAAFAGANPGPFRMVHLSRITVSSEKEARQLLESVQNGRVFEDTARSQSLDLYKEQGGDMGVKMAWEVYRDLADEGERESALSLKRGEFSPVVKVPDGWAFFRAAEDPRNADFQAEETLEKARSYMRQFEGGRMENWLVERAAEFTAQGGESGFAEAAESRGLELRRFGPVNLNYGNVSLFNPLDPSISGLSSAAENENFWKAAFTTPLNTPSAPFTLDENVVILIPVEEKTSDEAEEKSIADWYSRGWIEYAMDGTIRNAFASSKKFENNFGTTFFSNFFSDQF
ncbi:MAG: SurA N-terminal domain-containing protein [Treponema sp.]|jgi:hypothetical protein|nr:SurA N-terminal domain-containing protein [Treponema sp.]